MCLVSVIIPVYNASDFITRSMKSVLHQDGMGKGSIQLIVVDDGSTDDSWEQIQSATSALSQYAEVKIIQKENGGVVSAVNAALPFVKGKYLAFNGADDEWMPDKLYKQLSVLNDDPQCVAVHSDLSVINTHGEVVRKSFMKEVLGLSGIVNKGFCDLVMSNYVSGGTILCRVDVSRQFTPIPDNVYAEDYWFALCMNVFGKVSFLDEPLVLYRYHGSNDSLSLNQRTSRIKISQNLTRHRDILKVYYSCDVSRRLAKRRREFVKWRINSLFALIEICNGSNIVVGLTKQVATSLKRFMINKWFIKSLRETVGLYRKLG